MSLKFAKVAPKSSKNNKVFLHLMFEGGDADTQHPVTVELPGITFDQKDSSAVISFIEKYKLLSEILDINSSQYLRKYTKVYELYGEEIAGMFEDSPNDPENDGQDKCYLYSIEVHAFDQDGSEYHAYA